MDKFLKAFLAKGCVYFYSVTALKSTLISLLFSYQGMKHYMVAHDCLVNFTHSINVSLGPSNRSNSVSSLDLEGESVSELGAGPSGSNGVEALQLLEHEQGKVRPTSVAQQQRIYLVTNEHCFPVSGLCPVDYILAIKLTFIHSSYSS